MNNFSRVNFDSVNQGNFTHVNSREKLAQQGGWPFYPGQLFSYKRGLK